VNTNALEEAKRKVNFERGPSVRWVGRKSRMRKFIARVVTMIKKKAVINFH
jgi:hypothetical protein